MEGEFADGKGGLFMDNVNLKSFHDLASIADPCHQARATHLEVISLGVAGRRRGQPTRFRARAGWTGPAGPDRIDPPKSWFFHFLND